MGEKLNPATDDLSFFSQKVRVRVCGLLKNGDSLLLIKHHSIGPKGVLWSPPGGGVMFGDSLEDTLKREFLEETNLKIEILNFLFINEFIDQKHHAVEVFYQVRKIGGKLMLGEDPELSSDNQILNDIRYLTFEEIDNMDTSILHNIFKEVNSSKDIFNLTGLYSFVH